MSTRPRNQMPVHPLRAELEEARENELKTQAIAALPVEIATAPEATQLSLEEQHVASLGISPDSWRPISLLNSAHYETLLTSNSLAPELAKRLEAYKTLAASQ